MLEYHLLQINVCITFLGKGTYEIRLKNIFGLFLKKSTVCPRVLCIGVECGGQKCQNSVVGVAVNYHFLVNVEKSCFPPLFPSN